MYKTIKSLIKVLVNFGKEILNLYSMNEMKLIIAAGRYCASLHEETGETIPEVVAAAYIDGAEYWIDKTIERAYEFVANSYNGTPKEQFVKRLAEDMRKAMKGD
jgi:hypothetical protein